MTNILICTVGGSHQPIVSAITELKPDHVVFICTDKDPATGQPGSNTQITGVGNCLKTHPSVEKPTLPNIPTQAGLQADQFTLRPTIADDLDSIYQDCSNAIVEVLAKFPDAKLYADYTGGTKSMSAGLAMAALERQDIALQLVTGGRSDLVKVQDGLQYTIAANSDKIRFARNIAPYQQAWTRYAYSEALAGVKQLKPPHQQELRSAYSRFRDLSMAFAEWDNFNHAQALQTLKHYATSLNPDYRAYLTQAMRLNDNTPAKRDAARLLDLYLNAQRRAAQGRYDDAVARVYRLIEWTAQWLLKTQKNIETANVSPAQIPAHCQLSQNSKGQWQAGLFNAWQLVAHHTNGPAAQFINAEQQVLRNHIETRNHSILAHGFEPVSLADWQPIQIWLADKFIPMLLTETKLTRMPPQLPQYLPD